jgi:hypothetical protein
MRSRSIWFYCRWAVSKVFFRLESDGTPEEMAEMLGKFDPVSSSVYSAARIEDLGIEEEGGLPENEGYSLSGVIELVISAEEYEATFLNHFGFALKNQFADIANYFGSEFTFYSIRSVRQTDFQAIETGPFWVSDMFLESRYAVSAVPDDDFRLALLSRAGASAGAEELEFSMPASFDAREFLFLHRAAYLIWQILENISDTRPDFSQDLRSYQVYISRINSSIESGNFQRARGMIPITTVFVASISFSLIFFLFLSVKLISKIVGLLIGEGSASFVERYPLFTGTFLVLVLCFFVSLSL